MSICEHDKKPKECLITNCPNFMLASHTSPHGEGESWEREFAKQFGQSVFGDRIKDFVRDTIRSQRASAVKELRASIEGMKKPATDTSFIDDEADRQNYNTALDAVLSLIDQRK